MSELYECQAPCIKKLDGFSANKGGQKITEFPVLLIGQLAKNEKYKAAMTGDELMTYCLSTILDGQELLSGRIIMLECKPIAALISLYERFGFGLIEEEEPASNGLVQMIRILQEHELVSPPVDDKLKQLLEE